jgi:hypothetical protein
MSDTLSIACKDCKKHLWIGQDSWGGAVIYSRSTKDMDALEEFLYKHEDHELMFTRKMVDYFFDYEEVESGIDEPKKIGWIRRLIRRLKR